MPNLQGWQPDPREAYNDVHPVWRTMTARLRPLDPYFCGHCHGLIIDGERYDAAAVSGTGLWGYVNPSRVHQRCRGDFIKWRNEKFAEHYQLIVRSCMVCDGYMGTKDGAVGVSHGICSDECMKRWDEQDE